MKKFLVLIHCIIFNFNFSSALIISEIMYDPSGSDTGREWIEVYNDTSSPIDLKTYKFFESNINHGLNFVSGSEILEAGQYAIIADNTTFFMSDYPTFSGNLFDSAFSLSNSGETLEMRDQSGATADSTSYSPQTDSSGTGNTLSKISGSLSASVATPGYVNSIFISNNLSSTTTTPQSTSTNTTQIQNNSYSYGGKRTYMLGDIKLLTAKEIYTTVGAVTQFEVRNQDSRNQNINGTVYWSFGDATGGQGATTSHVYYSPGVYDVFVEVDNSSVYGIDKVKVFARDPLLEVRSTSSGVVIHNHDEEDINIGNFFIHCSNGIFKIARHFVIDRDEEVLVHNRSLGFDCKDPTLRFENNSPVSNFKKETKANITNNNIKSSSSLIIRGTSTKVNSNRNSNKFVNPKKATTTEKSLNLVSAKSEVKSSNVEKPVVTGVKKWLYWIYE